MKRVMTVAAVCLMIGAGGPPLAWAQDDARRPATTTFFGDTGLWFVPTGEILPAGRVSVSGYRANFDRDEGFSDISHFAVTFGVGVADRLEVFGSFRADTRIDRDFRPVSDGGVLNAYPFVNDGWTGDSVGDLLVGAKVNLASQHRQQPVGAAVRATVQLPTGDDEAGVSTGKTTFYLDGMVSREVNERVEVAGFGGVVIRQDPDGVDLSNGLRWGAGIGFPTRRAFRVFAEVHGEEPFEDAVTVGPFALPIEGATDVTLGAIWQGANGVFAGAGLNWATRLRSRDEAGSFESETGDALGFQLRVGYHPGVKVYAPPPPPPPPPPPANRPPTVKAACNPCTVTVCETSTVTAEGQDPDGDALSYRWSAPAGTLASPSAQQSVWTAPCEVGAVPVTVTVDDGKGGTASDTVTIQVVAAPKQEFVFEDVHFDFDRYTLRPDATRLLDEAVTALEADPALRLEVEGHTCNIGTAEYNLALGERRAQAVRDYLTSRGIGATRLTTVSYGEERPKHDNAREETRRLNRRAAMVVRVQ